MSSGLGRCGGGSEGVESMSDFFLFLVDGVGVAEAEAEGARDLDGDISFPGFPMWLELGS